VLFTLAATSQAMAQTSVQVNVQDDLGNNLSGLNVYAFDNTTYTGNSAVTDASGNAQFTLADGDYRLRVDKSGTQYFSGANNHCSVPACTSVSVEVPRAVEVTVSSSAGGFESGLNVYAFTGTTYASKSAVTDANGVATFQLLSDDYRFRIDKNGTQFFTSPTNHCSIPGCTAITYEVPESVTVTVTGAGGPEQGLTVYAFDGTTYVNKSAVTDVNGEAEFTLLPGDYRFRIDKSGTEYFTDTANHCSVPGCNSVSFQMPAQVTVNVTSSSGSAEAGLNVYAFDGSTYVNKSAITDANGDAVFTLLAGGYRFRIDKNGTQFFTDAVNHCSVPGCTDISYEIPESVTVTVTSSGDGFEAGLTVYAFDGSTYVNKSAVTDVYGEAVFTLLPGDYRFRIDKNGTQFFTDTVNHCTAPGCTAVAYEVPESVTVTVTSSGGGVEEGLNVYAFDGSTYANKSAVTDVNGEAQFTLLPGDYRFRIDKNGTQFFTDDVNHCTAPGCTAVTYDVPESVVVSVTNNAGGVEQGLNVYAFDGSTYVNKSAVTDSNGEALLSLLPGNYRFRVDKGGSQYFTDTVNHCAVPGCTFATVEVSANLSAYVVDPALGACLDAAGSANSWTAPADVTSLSCNGQGVTNLTGLANFSNLTSLSLTNNAITLLNELSGLTNLTSLDLSGNISLECSQLGDLDGVLGAGVITHPSSCLGEGEQVFNVLNPGKPATNLFSFAAASTPVGDIITSAVTYNPGTDSYDGSVYLIDGTNGNALLEIQNPSPTGSDYFGWSVASTSNGNIVVGAWNDEVGGIAAGAVYLFSGVDGTLLQTFTNPSPNVDDRYGYSLATTSNGRLIVGAYQEAGGGVVYVYDDQGMLSQTLFNGSGDSNGEFGKAIATTSFGDIVIGAPKQDVIVGPITLTDAGAVHLVSELGGTLLLTIDNPSPADFDDYGSAVATSALDDLIISARFLDNNALDDGSVFVHDSLDGSLRWSIANPLADSNGQFAATVAGTPQGHVVVGSVNDDAGADNSGRVFVFDGNDGSLINVIDNPNPLANVNFGQGLAITPVGQIAVGAFGADGGFGQLYLFTSVGTGESLDLLNEQDFPDPNLEACVIGEAAANGWSTTGEVTSLGCSNSDIVDVTGLEILTNLTTVDLTGNTEILCSDLDDLEAALPSTSVTRPNPCDLGGGAGTAQVQNLHNAQGQRVVKTVNGDPNTAVHFIYDQAGQVIAEIDSSTGATLREYIYVNGQQVAVVDDTGTQEEGTYFVHIDHLGTPQKITDDTQTIIWDAVYEPFGKTEVVTASIENNVRFPGQYEDTETELHYNYFRDYDPSLGRYVESDPIGLRGGMNTFLYASASPALFSDTYGLMVSGSFISRPKYNITDFGFNPFDGLAKPGFNKWGFVKFIRASGQVSGFVNIDVRCTTECETWEIHEKVSVDFAGSTTWGFNAYSAALGFALGGPLSIGAKLALWAGANTSLIGGAALEAEYKLLQQANTKAGSVISGILAYGPTAICAMGVPF